MSHRFWVKLFTAVVLMFGVCSSHGLTLKSMRSGATTPLEIQLYDTKRTERALAVRTSDGTIHYADMMPVVSSFSGGMFTRMDNQVYQIGVEQKFFITTTPDTTSFSFKMSAAGNFLIDWGDDTVEWIISPNTSPRTYSHNYAAAKEYTIGIGGRATDYNGYWYTATISFAQNQNVAGIDGSLGAVFGTIGDGSGPHQQPRFYKTFARCTNLKSSIPENLFDGVWGQADGTMFAFTFQYTGVTGSIPKDLFAGMSGQFAGSEYYHTFEGCSGLTGQIPQNLFAGEHGGEVSCLFEATFRLCSGLTGPIPENLFGGVGGAPQSWQFFATFEGCSGLTDIPENLFGDINGDLAADTFTAMFQDCSGLSSQSAKINGKYLYEIWPDALSNNVGGCYYGATGLSDYANIPSAWKDVRGKCPAQD